MLVWPLVLVVRGQLVQRAAGDLEIVVAVVHGEPVLDLRPLRHLGVEPARQIAVHAGGVEFVHLPAQPALEALVVGGGAGHFVAEHDRVHQSIAEAGGVALVVPESDLVLVAPLRLGVAGHHGVLHVAHHDLAICRLVEIHPAVVQEGAARERVGAGQRHELLLLRVVERAGAAALGVAQRVAALDGEGGRRRRAQGLAGGRGRAGREQRGADQCTGHETP